MGYLGVCFGAIYRIAWAFHFRQTHRVVDLANFYIFLGILLAAWMDNLYLTIISTSLCIFFSSGGHFGFSVYISATWIMRDSSLDHIHTSYIDHVPPSSLVTQYNIENYE